MNNVTAITAGLWGKVQAGEFIGKDEMLPAEVQSELNRQTATVINVLFRQLRAIFPAWKQAWPDMPAYKAAKKEWLQGFVEAGLQSFDQLQFGLMRARQAARDFIPNVGTFIDWCTPTPEMMGLPSLNSAFREACRNAHPTMAGQAKWSHDAIWHTAKECGFESLNKLDTALSLKLFERNYVITVRRIVAGKPLLPMPLALPEYIPVRSSREKATEALNAIRAARRGVASHA